MELRLLVEPAGAAEGVRDLFAGVIDQRHERFRFGDMRGEELHRFEHVAAGIADEGVGHGAHARRRAEEGRGEILRRADEALHLRIGPARRFASDRGAIGGEEVHLGAAAVAGMHVHEGRARDGEAHFVGVVGGDAGNAGLLQEQRLHFRELGHGAGDLHDLLFGGHDLALGEEALHAGARREALDHADRRLERGDHAAAHEDGEGHFRVAVRGDDARGVGEVLVGLRARAAPPPARYRRGGRGRRLSMAHDFTAARKALAPASIMPTSAPDEMKS